MAPEIPGPFIDAVVRAISRVSVAGDGVFLPRLKQVVFAQPDRKISQCDLGHAQILRTVQETIMSFTEGDAS